MQFSTKNTFADNFSYSDQKQALTDVTSTSGLSTEECAVMLMTSEDDCFSKLPALNEALRLEGLPIEIDLHLKPLLKSPNPNPQRKEDKDIGDNGDIKNIGDIRDLPPLAISRFFGQDEARFESLKIEELQSHLSKENIPLRKDDLPLVVLSPSFNIENPKYTSIYKIIHEYVLPKWRQYLTVKNQKRYPCTKKRRADSYKKKIMRDLREFYRILFRKRFHPSEYKTMQDVKDCIQKLFIELGFHACNEDLEDIYLFKFLHQTHKNTLSKTFGDMEGNDTSPFNCVDRFNYTMYNSFITNALSSQIYYFVFTNFSTFYSENVMGDVRKQTMTVINEILAFYTKLEVSSTVAKYVTDF